MGKCPTRNIAKHSDCASGSHQFIISKWAIKADRQTATAVICQKCLLHIEGTQDLRELVKVLHDVSDDTAATQASS